MEEVGPLSSSLAPINLGGQVVELPGLRAANERVDFAPGVVDDLTFGFARVADGDAALSLRELHAVAVGATEGTFDPRSDLFLGTQESTPSCSMCD